MAVQTALRLTVALLTRNVIHANQPNPLLWIDLQSNCDRSCSATLITQSFCFYKPERYSTGYFDTIIICSYNLISKKTWLDCINNIIIQSRKEHFGGLISFHPDCRLGALYETWTHTRLLSLPPQGSVSAIPPKVHINSIYESVDLLSYRQLHRITLSSIMFYSSAWKGRFVDNLHLNLRGIFTDKHHRLKNWVNTYFSSFLLPSLYLISFL